MGWFSEHGFTCRCVLSDNSSSYRTRERRKANTAINRNPIRTKPYISRINGKAALFIAAGFCEAPVSPGRVDFDMPF